MKRELSYQLMKIKQNKILKMSRRPRKEYLPRIYQMKYRKYSIKTLKLKGMSLRIMTISLMKMNRNREITHKLKIMTLQNVQANPQMTSKYHQIIPMKVCIPTLHRILN